MTLTVIFPGYKNTRGDFPSNFKKKGGADRPWSGPEIFLGHRLMLFWAPGPLPLLGQKIISPVQLLPSLSRRVFHRPPRHRGPRQKTHTPMGTELVLDRKKRTPSGTGVWADETFPPKLPWRERVGQEFSARIPRGDRRPTVITVTPPLHRGVTLTVITVTRPA